MATIGLFGLMGSGKSTLAGWFREWGARVVEGDALGWDVLREPGIESALIAAFGRGVAGADGRIDRAALGEIVFRDAAALARLNAIVQPRLLARVRDALARESDAARGAPVVLDAAMLTTWRLEPELDGVVHVLAAEESRAARIAAARGLSRENAAARVRGQRLPEPDGAKHLWLVRNDGDLAALRRRADAVWQAIRALP